MNSSIWVNVNVQSPLTYITHLLVKDDNSYHCHGMWHVVSQLVIKICACPLRTPEQCYVKSKLLKARVTFGHLILLSYCISFIISWYDAMSHDMQRAIIDVIGQRCFGYQYEWKGEKKERFAKNWFLIDVNALDKTILPLFWGK